MCPPWVSQVWRYLCRENSHRPFIRLNTTTYWNTGKVPAGKTRQYFALAIAQSRMKGARGSPFSPKSCTLPQLTWA